MAGTPKTRSASTREGSLPVPSDLSDELAPIATELLVLHESVLWSAQGQFEQMKLWRAMNYILGVPAAVLAAVAGGKGLSTGDHTIAGALALVAAGLSATLTTINPSRRVAQAQVAANAYLELQTAIRQLLLIQLRRCSYSEATKELRVVTEGRDKVNKAADPPNFYSRWRAKRSIERGGQDYTAHEGDIGAI